MGLSILLASAWRDDTPRLSFPVWEITVVVDDNVASFSGGLGSNNALGRDNLSSERCLVLVNVDRNSRLIVVWLGLKKVFSGNLRATIWKRKPMR